MKNFHQTNFFVLFSIMLVLFIMTGFYSQGQAGIDPSPEQPVTGLQELNQPPDIFGAEMNSINDTHGLQEMSNINTHWIRLNGVLWSEVETSPGVYEWDKLADLDQQLLNAQAKGMQVVLVVRSTPTWAQEIPGYYCGPMKAEYIPNFVNFIGQLVSRYKDQVTYWEIWNEPDVDHSLTPLDDYYGCWGKLDDSYYYGGENFGQVLTEVYPIIKNNDPGGEVIIGGLSLACKEIGPYCSDDLSLNFLEGILKVGKGTNFDGIAFHAYDYYKGSVGNYANEKWNSYSSTTGPVELAKINYLNRILQIYGIEGKYLLNTELALLCEQQGCEDPQSQVAQDFERTKEYYVAQSYAATRARNLEMAVWYGVRNGRGESDLLYLDLIPRPAYYAFGYAKTRLAEATYSRDINTYPGVMGFEFLLPESLLLPERLLWVIWAKDGLNHQVNLPGNYLSITDVDGTVKIGLTPDSVMVTVEPYYIELPIININHYLLYLPLSVKLEAGIWNGDFENILSNGQPAFWQVTIGGSPGLSASSITVPPKYPGFGYDPDLPHGLVSMRLGSEAYPCEAVPVNSAAIIEQTFKVPTTEGVFPVRLTFKYIMYTEDNSISNKYDKFEVHVISNEYGDDKRYVSGDVQKGVTTCGVWDRVPDTGWETVSIDLVFPKDYRGKTITVSFENWNRFDKWFNTITYIDDVNIEYGP